MIALLQRVSEASVAVENRPRSAIGAGLLVLVGVEREDNEVRAEKMLRRVLNYRVFADDGGRMNLSLEQTGGGLLLVPQFTLVADTQKGTRPGFSRGASPEQGERLFGYLCNRAEQLHPRVARGEFGAHMQVSLTNDGPVTFLLKT